MSVDKSASVHNAIWLELKASKTDTHTDIDIEPTIIYLFGSALKYSRVTGSFILLMAKPITVVAAFQFTVLLFIVLNSSNLRRHQI